MLRLETKQRLSATIRTLRIRLLRDLGDTTQVKSSSEADSRRTIPAETTSESAYGERVKAAGALFLQRISVFKCLETQGLRSPPIVNGGLASVGYRAFIEAMPERPKDEVKAYASLLGRGFLELSSELPGLFCPSNDASELTIPGKSVLDVVTALDDELLAPAWLDDTTPGWIYQYWNDLDREAIDAHLDAQNKLDGRDIAAKTQVFTERYMVDWLLENSLGELWLRIGEKNGWDCEAERATEVGAVEPSWKYYLPEPLDEQSVLLAPKSIRDVKVLDPACGCGHFLVAAFDRLVTLYRKEAQYLGQTWSDREIAESILENNLFGLDVDPKAVRLASTVLYLKSKRFCRDSAPARVHLAAPSLRLFEAWEQSSTFEAIYPAFEREFGASKEGVRRFIETLADASHMGSLLKMEVAFARLKAQGKEARVWDLLEPLLVQSTDPEAVVLGCDRELRQLCSRFYRLLSVGGYDVVIGNPPYFGTQSLADATYIDEHYPQSKENLCTALIERSMAWVRSGGVIAFVTVRNWLYISQLQAFRRHVLTTFAPTRVVDLELGGFESLPGVEGVLFVARSGGDKECVVVRANGSEPEAKNASILRRDEIYRTEPSLLARLPGSPFVYRWPKAFLQDYLSQPSLGSVAPVRVGMKTSDNLRFLRRPWELRNGQVIQAITQPEQSTYQAYVKGAGGKAWIEPLSELVNWREQGLEIRIALKAAYGQGPQGERHFYRPGVAFSTIGRSFVARAHRYPSLFDVAGSSVFPSDVPSTVCLLNSRLAREVVESLNPTINFQVGDVGRVPYRPDPEASHIFGLLEAAFADYERAVEPSFRFERPRAVSWRYTQQWAERAVDRRAGEALPPYLPEFDAPSPEAQISFAVGVSLGRFGQAGEGILDEAPDSALRDGVLFLASDGHDSLEDPACATLHALWQLHGGLLDTRSDLRRYLQDSFFSYHRRLYENRPIYFPFASAKKHFVAFISIHRFKRVTLARLVEHHLLPARVRLEQALCSERGATSNGFTGAEGGRNASEVGRLLEELLGFIAAVTTVSECGPSAPEPRTPPRERDAPFEMHLDDGVLVNSAALWPLLEPLWKEPKKWWSQLAARRGPKGTHFDWSKTAKRYFPARVEAACREDPVLASAHDCLQMYHPDVASYWETRTKEKRRAVRDRASLGANEATAPSGEGPRAVGGRRRKSAER